MALTGQGDCIRVELISQITDVSSDIISGQTRRYDLIKTRHNTKPSITASFNGA